MPQTPLLRRINDHLKRAGTGATRFGREAVRDPNLVSDLRAGRKPGRRLEARIIAWLDAREGERGGRT